MSRAAEKILDYLRSRVGQRADVSLDMPLLSTGLLDSLLLIDIIAFAERELGVSVPDEELVPENFGSPRTFVELLDSLATR